MEIHHGLKHLLIHSFLRARLRLRVSSMTAVAVPHAAVLHKGTCIV